MPMYYTYENCGAHLDYGERCDCQKETQTTNVQRTAVFTMLQPTKYTKH